MPPIKELKRSKGRTTSFRLTATEDWKLKRISDKLEITQSQILRAFLSKDTTAIIDFLDATN